MVKKRKVSQNSINSKSVPPDIILSIFERLPVKSLIRFKCLSKFYSNVISDPSFATIHRPFRNPKPALLITCSAKLQLSQIFYIADQNGGAATCCLTVPPRFSRYTTQSANGIVCMDFGICASVCNPSTSQAVSLPFIIPKNSPAANSTSYCVNFFGFDPKNKQYKVLNSWGQHYQSDTEYRVYTLGGGPSSQWRVLQGGPPHLYAQRESICINGIVFFRGWVKIKLKTAALVSFDVERESFRVIDLPRGAPIGVGTSCLIQLAGRLAIVDYLLDRDHYCFWMLEDYCNEIWVQNYILFPLHLKKLSTGENYVVAGSIDTGEIMIVPQCLSTPFYVIYYNLAKSIVRRVDISGLPGYDSLDLSCNQVAVTNYVDNILPLP